jgi:hypothetical protein
LSNAASTWLLTFISAPSLTLMPLGMLMVSSSFWMGRSSLLKSPLAAATAPPRTIWVKESMARC